MTDLREVLTCSHPQQQQRKMTNWLRSNRLQLNDAKTEVLWIATDRQQNLLSTTCVFINDLELHLTTFVQNLGIYLDNAALMKQHVANTIVGCFTALRLIRSTRQSISTTVLKSLANALVLTKLDYGNATLTGKPSYLLNCLQLVLNAAAHVIHRSRWMDHLTPLLVNLH